MSIRGVNQQSDRGSIRDLVNKVDENDENIPPTSFELRIKKLYEQSLISNNQLLVESLGLIPACHNIKNPVSLYGHRMYIKQLESKSANNIEQIKQEIAPYFEVNDESLKNMLQSKLKQIKAQSIIVQKNELVKIAGVGTKSNLKRSFRRVV